ncbi:hypothetical protein GCM10010270_40790 [Streptomyces violaceus]|nr:hypothetical protein GCM10010270_40790 [Streptomyces janthinus]
MPSRAPRGLAHVPGGQMPILGFGVFQIPEDQTQQAVEAALDAGYRLLDAAAAWLGGVRFDT